MLEEMKNNALREAEELNNKIDKAVDTKIEQLQAKVDGIQARIDQAKESRFTWLIVAGIAAALLSFVGLIALS